jgi:hypothetical protein
MLGTLKSNRKVKPVLTAFVSIWVLLTVLIIGLSIVVSLLLGALVLTMYVPFILFDILLEKLFNKG